MSKHFVYGKYSSIDQANRAVERLIKGGLPEQGITFVGENASMKSSDFPYKSFTSEDVDKKYDSRDDFWNNITGYFSGEDNMGTDPGDVNALNLKTYRNSIKEGEVLILINKEHQEQVGRLDKELNSKDVHDTSDNSKMASDEGIHFERHYEDGDPDDTHTNYKN